jgi:hypothetical protein
VKNTLGFDVYGTLVDPSGMAKHLARDLGVEAANFAKFAPVRRLTIIFADIKLQRFS